MWAPGSSVTAVAVRAEVERILASPTFSNADRISRFLRYVVEQSLLGGASGLKEFAVGIEVFGRDSTFDPRSDSVVRVEARRLRSKLRDYYAAEGASDAVVISMPKGAYVPEFHSRVESSPPAAYRRMAAVSAVVASVTLVLVAGWLALRSPAAPALAVAVLPLENLSTDSANGFLCHGIADEVASRLSGAGIQVVTRGAAGPFNAGADLRDIASRRQAGFALEGSAAFDGDRMRITVTLIDLRTLSSVWMETYERRVIDRLGTEKELAGTIAGAVTARLKAHSRD